MIDFQMEKIKCTKNLSFSPSSNKAFCLQDNKVQNSFTQTQIRQNIYIKKN